MVYQLLVRQKPGYLAEPILGESVWELAESWEFSPDRLQLTMKLRQNRSQNLPLLNGRPVDVEDVVFSWKRLERIGTNRSLHANSVNPLAPVVSVNAVDNRTIAIKTAFPYAPLLPLIGLSTGGNFYISPREADDLLDVRRTQVGSGPWQLVEYLPGIHIVYKRHEGYWDQSKVYVDRLEFPIIPEYAARRSQFLAGNV